MTKVPKCGKSIVSGIQKIKFRCSIWFFDFLMNFSFSLKRFSRIFMISRSYQKIKSRLEHWDFTLFSLSLKGSYQEKIKSEMWTIQLSFFSVGRVFDNFFMIFRVWPDPSIIKFLSLPYNRTQSLNWKIHPLASKKS